MKHLLKKLSIAGAGGKGGKPKPPIYKPPVMGELQYGASHSYAETLDLLSDGPIEGIVNAHGELVNGLNILQGIYLDNTPVAVTSESGRKTNSLTPLETETINSLNLELNSSEGATYLSQFFQELAKTNDRSEAGRVTALKSSTDGAIRSSEEGSAPNVANMLFMVARVAAKSHDDNTFPNDFSPENASNYALYIRGFIKYRGSSDKVFPWYLNGERQTGYNDNNAAFRNDNQTRGDVEKGSLIWADSNDLDTSKFLFGLFPSQNLMRDGNQDSWFWDHTNGRPPTSLFTGNTEVLNASILPDLNLILNKLYNENNKGQDTDNILQRDLAKRALENMGWRGDGVNELLPTHLKATSSGVVICKVTTDGNSNLVDKQILDGDSLLGMQTLPYGSGYGFDLIAVMENIGITVTDVTCPEISSAGVLSGKMHGFLIFEFQVETAYSLLSNNHFVNAIFQTFKIPDDIILALKDLSSLKYAKRSNSIIASTLKYNYSNILAEIRKGEESQTPFNNFKKIFIDHQYGRELFGPFSIGSSNIQRIEEGQEMLLKKSSVYQDVGGGGFDTDGNPIPTH